MLEIKGLHLLKSKVAQANTTYFGNEQFPYGYHGIYIVV